MSDALADHDADLVLFDVPPPHNGVRTIDAYRQTWPCLFEFLGSGAAPTPTSPPTPRSLRTNNTRTA